MSRLPGYTFVEEVYRGSRSLVYRARRDEDGERVVVKTPLAALPSADEVRRYQREYELGRLFDGARVVAYHAFLSAPERLALVVEDFGAVSLEELVPAQGFDLDTFLKLTVELTEGLRAIHGGGVIHKDVKPRNVVVSPDLGTVKWIDFSNSTRLAREARQGAPPARIEGTLSYMSPEQTGRMNRSVDERTDLYSLGVTLYRMLTGRLPFEADEALELIHCHLARQCAAPREVKASVAPVVSEIVLRLMAKNPEDRYQTCEGLRADLERCAVALRQGQEPGRISFPLGADDVGRRFRIPQKLYGRSRELAILEAAFERIDTRRAAGEEGPELLLVVGRSGVGKSVLVSELQRVVTARRGFFVAGKYQRSRDSIPYSGIRQAVAALCDYLLAEPAAEAWRRRILAALGQSAQMLFAVLPELERLLGPQPAVPRTDPQEDENRFHATFLRLLGALTTGDQPLVVFLDDIQWMDSASLKLLATTMRGQGVAPMLAIGAFRGPEVTPSHPLAEALAGFAASGCPLSTLPLGNLAPDDVAALIAEAVSRPSSEVGPLAELVCAKTEGNGFFTAEFLSSVEREGLLALEDGVWRWDVERIRARDVTDNVVELMAGKVDSLAARSREVLQLAACLGNVFDLGTLAEAYDACHDGRPRAPREVLRHLWPAIEAGLVFPVDGRALDLLHGAAGDDLECRLKFAHDRVQEAAYASIDEIRREALHLAIGRRMAAELDPEASPERLFEVVHQWNRAGRRITEESEKVAVASWYLAAGRKAKQSTAYQAAVDYLAAGVALLPEPAWSSQYRLAFDLHRELSEAQCLVGRCADAEPLYELLLSKARSDQDHLEVRLVQLAGLLLQGRYADGVAVGRAALRLLAVELPAEDEDVRGLWGSELAALPERFDPHRVAAWVDRPRMSDERARWQMKLLNRIGACAYFENRPELHRWVAVKRTALSVQFGNDETSAVGYATFATHVSLRLRQDYDEACALGDMAVALADRFDNLTQRGRTGLVVYGFLHPWKRPLRDAAPHLVESHRFCVEGGDPAFATFAISDALNAKLVSGCPLAEIREEAKRLMPFWQRNRTPYFESTTRPGVLQPLANLLGETKAPDSFDDEGFAEEEFLREVTDKPYYPTFFYSAKLRSLYLFGHHRTALRLLDEAARTIERIGYHFIVPETWLFMALTLAAVLDQEDAEKRAEHEALLSKYRNQMKVWAGHCPANFLHKHLLIEAECQRLAGGPSASALYEQAVASAEQYGYLNNVALGHELHGRFWLAKGDREIARVYLGRARASYERWGATAKVADLDARHRDLELTAPRHAPGPEAEWMTHHDLDLGAVLEASQVISSEHQLEKLLRRMMKIIIVTAGARRGCLVLARDEGLLVEAEVDLNTDEAPVLRKVPIEAHRGIPAAIVRHVMSGGTELVLDDASSDERFGSNPYVSRSRVKSVLCLPLANDGKVAGVVYLENDLVSHAFPAQRVAVLRALVAQAAISLEKAFLYEGLQAEVAEHRRTEKRLRAHAAELERFAFTVSHDLRNPLVTIRGFLGLARCDLAREDLERLNHDLSTIETASEKMGRLLEGLLELASVSRPMSAPAEVSLRELAHEAVERLGKAITERGIEVEIDQDLPRVVGDRTRLGEMMEHLIGNAVKFIGDAGAPRITVGFRRDGEAVFFVCDNGVGIEARYHKKVFGLFEQLDPECEGIGIGLALAGRIVEVHGGRIWVESSGLGRGSSFCFVLPSMTSAKPMSGPKKADS